jgi:hypothetical protein
LDTADTVRLDFTMPGLLSALLPLLFIFFALIRQSFIRANVFAFDHV